MLAVLREKNLDPEIIEYLNDPPSKKQIQAILKMMDAGPRDIVRKKEKLYKELGLDAPDVSDDALLEAMTKNPVLIERPIVVVGKKAALARPIENVLAIL